MKVAEMSRKPWATDSVYAFRAEAKGGELTLYILDVIDPFFE